MKKFSKDHFIFQLEQIIKFLPGNIFWKDLEGKYLGCNDNVAKLLKLKSSSEIIGKTDEHLLGRKYAALVKPTNILTLTKKNEICREELGFDESGNKAIYLTKKKPLFDKKKNVVGLIGMSINITDRKILEEKLMLAKKRAEEANKAKLEFLDHAVTEMRKPLKELKKSLKKIQPKLSGSEIQQFTSMMGSMNAVLHDMDNFGKFNLLAKDKFSNNGETFSLQIPKNLPEDFKTFHEFYHQLGLTKRESECVYYCIRGLTAKQIGRKIGLSNRTIEFYLNNAKCKLDCKTKQDIIYKIFEAGVI